MKASRFATWAILLGYLSLNATPALAQESKISMQAIRCAAIFSVLADTHAEDQQRASLFQAASVMFSGVYTEERGVQTGQDSAQEAARQRDGVLHALQKTYREHEALILEETILCGAWAEGFRAQGERYAFVPIIPKIIPQKIRQDYAAYASQAFKRWIR